MAEETIGPTNTQHKQIKQTDKSIKLYLAYLSVESAEEFVEAREGDCLKRACLSVLSRPLSPYVNPPEQRQVNNFAKELWHE